LEIDLLKHWQRGDRDSAIHTFEQAQTELAEQARRKGNYANKLPCLMLPQTLFSFEI